MAEEKLKYKRIMRPVEKRRVYIRKRKIPPKRPKPFPWHRIPVIRLPHRIAQLLDKLFKRKKIKLSEALSVAGDALAVGPAAVILASAAGPLVSRAVEELTKKRRE